MPNSCSLRRICRDLTRLAPLAAVLALGGCVVSVSPVVMEEDRADVPGLAGAWVNPNGDSALVWTEDRGLYQLTVVERTRDRSAFRAATGMLGGRLVADLSASLDEKPDAGLTSSVLGTVIPGHLLVALELRGDTLRVATLDYDSVQAALRSGVLRAPSANVEDGYVLTGPTSLLRPALAEYLRRPGALSDWEVWRRASRVVTTSASFPGEDETR